MRSDGDYVQTLRTAVDKLHTSELGSEELDALAKAILSSKSDELFDVLAPTVTGKSYLRVPNEAPSGSHPDIATIAIALAKRANALWADGVADSANRAYRAAVLLGADSNFINSSGLITQFVRDPDFGAICQLTPDKLDDLRKFSESANQANSEFDEVLQPVDESLDALFREHEPAKCEGMIRTGLVALEKAFSERKDFPERHWEVSSSAITLRAYAEHRAPATLPEVIKKLRSFESRTTDKDEKRWYREASTEPRELPTQPIELGGK